VKCNTCGRDLDATTIASATGVGGSFIVTLTDVPVLVCADHPETIEYRDRDFREELNDKLFFERAVPFSQPKGTFRKTQHCGMCGAAMDVAEKTSGHVEGRVTTRHAPPLAIAVDGPALTCGSCSAVQLESGDATFQDVAAGVDAAFASVGFKRNPVRFRG
jgi:hypothetical protein